MNSAATATARVANVLDIVLIRMTKSIARLRDLAEEVDPHLSDEYVAEMKEIADGFETLADAIHSSTRALGGQGRPGGDATVEQAPEQDSEGSVEVAG